MGKKALSLDALLLLLLVLVRVRVDTLVSAMIPRPPDLVAQVPILGDLLSPTALRLLADWMADPVSALLIMATFGLTLVYLLLDGWENWPRRSASPAEASTPEGGSDSSMRVIHAPPLQNRRGFMVIYDLLQELVKGRGVPAKASDPGGVRGASTQDRKLQLQPHPGNPRKAVKEHESEGWWSCYRAKLVTLYLIIFLITGVGTLLVVGLRHASEPARYAHDGGVLLTESAIQYLVDGKNPYVETYRGTPAEKAYPNGPGLSHYAYLPLAFLSGVPFYLASQAVLGWYDQRFVYLIALALALALAPRLASRPGDKLALVMLIGLNPIMGNDIIYGMNDILVVFWLLLAAHLARTDRMALSSLVLGLAVVTKGTVWPILPFYLLYLFRRELRGQSHPDRLQSRNSYYLAVLRKLVPLVVPVAIVALPFVLWNFGAMVDDTWSYNMGSTTVDSLPIKGWGIGNAVLALGWVSDIMDYFPFWIFEGLFALPILAVLLLRQWRLNTFNCMLMNYGLFFLVFVYFSRTMNANYIGYALTLAAIGYFGDDGRESGGVEIDRHRRAAEPALSPKK